MAGKSLQSGRLSARAQASASALRRMVSPDVLREVSALALLLGVAFVILAIASFNESDYGAAVWPEAASPHNLGGRIGAALVGKAFLYLGVATHLAVALLGVYASVIFFRRRIDNLRLKSIGAGLAVICFAGFFGGKLSGSAIMPSRGGIVGANLWEVLATNFGATGSVLILGFLSVIAFLLATDILLYPLLRDFLLGTEGQSAASALEDGEEYEIVFEKTDPDVIFTPESQSLRAAIAGVGPSQGTGVLSKLAGFFGMRDDGGESARLALAIEEDTSTSTALVQPEMLIDTRDREDIVEDVSDSMAAVAEANAIAAAPRAARPKKAKKKKKSDQPAEEAVDFKALARAYESPTADLLSEGTKADPTKTKREIEYCAAEIVKTLKHFNIDVEVVDVRRGPTITLYELKTPPNLQIKKIVRHEDELAMMLQAQKIRILAPIPGRRTVGIEVPNRERDTVSLREVVASKEFAAAAKKMQLPIALGLDAEGKPLIRDLAKTPHLLISGTTGSGKSVMQNIILMSLLMSRHWRDLKLVLVDPKCVELTPYEELGFLAAPIVTDMSKAVLVFEWLVEEMERRYDMFAKTRTKKISEFNELSYKERCERYASRGGNAEDIPEHMPFVVGMVDELADLMMASTDTRIDELICRVAQKARAAGIHLILATQRPSADVVTGLIKANVPARIAFKLPSAIDSRTVIGDKGAEKLLGLGDMLLNWNDGAGLMRAQSGFCDNPEIEAVCAEIRKRTAINYLVDIDTVSGADISDDMIGGQKKHEKFDEAVEQVLSTGRASAQFLRSALRVGYNAATTIVMQMEMAGILGPARGSKERDILMTLEEWHAIQSGGDDDGNYDEGDED